MEVSYLQKKKVLEAYFDRTAFAAWDRLTSELPVSWVRERVREGRNNTKNAMLSILPKNLSGFRVLDAGCGTGQLAFDLASRGANVIGVDVSEKLIALASERCPKELVNKISFYQGDMLDPQFGSFDFILLMDSLIHYQQDDILKVLNQLSGRVGKKIGFTIVPKTVTLSAKLLIGQIFPKGDKSPDVIPVNQKSLIKKSSDFPNLFSEKFQKIRSVRTGFYAADVLEFSK